MTALHAHVWGPQHDDDTFACVRRALELNVNFFDTAEMCVVAAQSRRNPIFHPQAGLGTATATAKTFLDALLKPAPPTSPAAPTSSPAKSASPTSALRSSAQRSRHHWLACVLRTLICIRFTGILALQCAAANILSGLSPKKCRCGRRC